MIIKLSWQCEKETFYGHFGFQQEMVYLPAEGPHQSQRKPLKKAFAGLPDTLGTRGKARSANAFSFFTESMVLASELPDITLNEVINEGGLLF